MLLATKVWQQKFGTSLVQVWFWSLATKVWYKFGFVVWRFCFGVCYKFRTSLLQVWYTFPTSLAQKTPKKQKFGTSLVPEKKYRKKTKHDAEITQLNVLHCHPSCCFHDIFFRNQTRTKLFLFFGFLVFFFEKLHLYHTLFLLLFKTQTCTKLLPFSSCVRLLLALFQVVAVFALPLHSPTTDPPPRFFPTVSHDIPCGFLNLHEPHEHKQD